LVSYQRGKIEVLYDSLPLEWAQGIGEDRVKAFSKITKRDARWLADPPTERQLNRLVREGFTESKLHKIKTKGQAADLLQNEDLKKAYLGR
jgi:hypothetical protein